MNDLIRQAIAAEAEERVDSRTVLAELHKRKKRRKPFGLIVGVATLTAAAAAAAVIIPTAVQKTDAAPASAPQPTPQNVLLIGTDDYNHTDALVFAHFDSDGSAAVISLPRDIFVGDQKINGLFLNDPQKLTNAVEQVTGANVDHYAAVKMSEFGKIADAVGGVEVCVVAATKDPVTGFALPAGRHTLSGAQALGFLRQRHGLARGDLDRTHRHQAFLAGLAAKITKDNAPALARAVSGSIKVDEDWDVLEFAQRFQGPLKIRTATLPVGEPVVRGNQFGFAPDLGQTKQFVEQQFGGEGSVQGGCVA